MKLCTTILLILMVYCIYCGTAQSMSVEDNEDDNLLATYARGISRPRTSRRRNVPIGLVRRQPRNYGRVRNRPGYIYVLKEQQTNYYKIGLSVTPFRRRRNLQTGNPRRLLFACPRWRVRDRYAAETNAKRQLRVAIGKSYH